MQNKTKATLTLAGCATLAAGTLPLANSGFIFGLLNHGFIAATIGGLADWFAVTALFHKPLGISYRTEILKRNRKHITDALIEFIGEDLLNTKNIMATVEKENAAKLLIDFLENYNGRKKVKELAGEVLAELFASIDTKKFSNEVAPIVETEIKNFDVSKIISAAVKTVTAEKNSREILTLLIETGQKIFKSAHMQEELYKKIVELRVAYENDSMGRALVLSSMNLTDEKILSILNENVEKKIFETITALKAEGIISTEQKMADQELTDNFARAVKTATSNINVENFQAEFASAFDGKIDVAAYIQNFLKVGDKIWQTEIDSLVDKKISEFVNDTALQNKFDTLIKNMIENLLNEYHDKIPALIRERMDKFDDEQLTEFVESRVSDDLQMIRINGSVCGAIAGMFLYIVSQIISQVIG